MTRLVSQITLVNNQSQATPSNFQQFIYTTLQYPSGVRFWNPANGYFYAWLESLSSTNQAVIWVNIPSSIPAGGTYRLYMVQDSNLSFDGNYWGEAPQLSSSYAQYDNGANVFNLYDNFAGTSLNTNKWTSLASVYTINNGLQITATPSTTDSNFLESVSTYSTPLIVEIYRYTTTSNWFGFSFPNTYTTGGVLFYDQNGWSMYQGSSQLSGGSESLDTWYIQTGILAPSGQASEDINYIDVITSSTGYYSGTSGNIYVGDNGGRGTIQWLRTRAYPPNGVMPAVSIVPVQAWNVYTT